MRPYRRNFSAVLGIALTVGITLTLKLVLPATCPASVIYNDGNQHTVSGPSADITITNDTPVTVTAGATITAAISSGNGLNGILSRNSPLTITGGSITGGITTNTDRDDGNGLLFGSTSSTTPLLISGGTFTGGSGGSSPGSGAVVNITNGSTATISGGNFVSSGSVTPVNATALMIQEDNASSIVISGGTFSGGPHNIEIYLALFEKSTLTFTGSNLSATYAVVDSFFDAYEIKGTLSDGSPIDVYVDAYQIGPDVVSPNEILFEGDRSAIAIPEPSSVVLAGIAVAIGSGIGVWRRKKSLSAYP